MLTIKNTIYSITLFGLLISCETTTQKVDDVVKLDYSDNDVLDSLYKSIPNSKDTIFLGFTMGMTEEEYVSHVKKMQKEGRSITLEKSVTYNTIVGKVSLGPGYVFTTSITSGVDKKAKGEGVYYLEPTYSSDGGKLIKLAIVSTEKWDDYDSDREGWLESKIKENSSEFDDDSFKQALLDNEILANQFDFIRQKGNLIIYETYLGIRYVSRKSLFADVTQFSDIFAWTAFYSISQ